MDLQIQIGQRLKAIRKILGYTIKSLSEATGVSSNLISLMENGRIEPSIIKIVRICEFYDISIDSLVFDTGKKFEDFLNDLGVLLMMYVELVKRVDQDQLILAGYFTKHELKALKVEGYRQLPANKNGIRVA